MNADECPHKIRAHDRSVDRLLETLSTLLPPSRTLLVSDNPSWQGPCGDVQVMSVEAAQNVTMQADCVCQNLVSLAGSMGHSWRKLAGKSMLKFVVGDPLPWLQSGEDTETLTIVTPSPWLSCKNTGPMRVIRIHQPVSQKLAVAAPSRAWPSKQLAVVLPAGITPAGCTQLHTVVEGMITANFSIVLITGAAQEQPCSLLHLAQFAVSPTSDQDAASVLSTSFALLQPAVYDSERGPVHAVSLAVGTPVVVIVSSSLESTTDTDAEVGLSKSERRSFSLTPVTQTLSVHGTAECIATLQGLATQQLRTPPSFDPRYDVDFVRLQWMRLMQLSEAMVPAALMPPEEPQRCQMATCFNWLRCLRGFSFYLEPLYEPMGAWTGRLQLIWSALATSPFRSHVESLACVTFAAVDFFNHRYYNGDGWKNLDRTKLRPLWQNGLNTLIWAPHDDPFAGDFGFAMMLRASSSSNFRAGFDISIPMYMGEPPNPSNVDLRSRRYLACFKGARYNRQEASVRNRLRDLHNGHDIHVLSRCAPFDSWPLSSKAACDEDSHNFDSLGFDEMLEHCTFTLAPRGAGTFSYRVFEAMAYGSIPVILSDTYRPPFQELINWADVAVHIPENSIDLLPSILRSIPASRVTHMQRAGLAAWKQHMKDYPTIVNSTLAILAARVNGNV